MTGRAYSHCTGHCTGPPMIAVRYRYTSPVGQKVGIENLIERPRVDLDNCKRTDFPLRRQPSARTAIQRTYHIAPCHVEPILSALWCYAPTGMIKVAPRKPGHSCQRRATATPCQRWLATWWPSGTGTGATTCRPMPSLSADHRRLEIRGCLRGAKHEERCRYTRNYRGPNLMCCNSPFSLSRRKCSTHRNPG